MWRGVLFLIALIGYVAGAETETAENPVDVKLNDETAVATEAIQHYIGFICAKGYRCIPVLECLPCEYGTYKDTAGSGLCVACPPDCTTLRKGAESRLECVPFCPPGYELSQCGNTCTKCRPGTYKPGWEKTVLCVECPVGSYPPIDRLGLTDEMECYEGEDVPEPSTTESTTTVVDCNATCLAPTNSTDSKLCSPSMKALFMCLKRRSGDCSISPYDELVEFYVEFHQDLKYQIAPKINTGDWEVIYSWFMKKCPVEDVPVSSTTVSITTVVDCNATCMAPSEAESNICSPSMKALFMCLKRRSDDCSISPYDELVEFYVEFHQDLKYQLGPKINTGDWEDIYSWFMNECPECLSDSDCGDGGQCVSGNCDCLTSSCSRLAYVALPGCGRYCQCDVASGEWRQQTCNHLSNELFDETINTCNRMDAVEPYMCASVQCENPCPSPPAGLTDICSHDVRQYIKCLRNQYTHCGIDPNGISVELYDQLSYLIASGPILQQGYNQYLRSCLVDECAATCIAPTATESNPCSPSIKALFMCLERRSEVCSVNPSDELLQFYSGFHQDLKNQLTHMVNTGNWEEIYDWFKNECPEDDTTTTYMPQTSPGSECLSDSDCGDGGQCVSGFCGCLTSSCSRLAYVALPGCGRYCQCDVASGEWRQQTCNPISNELFDETTNNCIGMDNVELDICASVQCENACPIPPTGLTDICSYDVRQYIKCLRNQVVYCDIDPASQYTGENFELYNQLSYMLASGDTLRLGYNEYLHSCLVGDQSMTGTPSSVPPPSSLSPAECVSSQDCGPGMRCDGGSCVCLNTYCIVESSVALPGCGRFCQCDVTSGTWQLHYCNVPYLFDETTNSCSIDNTMDIALCASVTCDTDCPLPPSGDVNICSDDVRQFIKCLRNTYLICGSNLLYQRTTLSMYLYNELDSLLADVNSLMMGYYEYMHKCLGGWDEANTTATGSPQPSMSASTPSASGFTSHPTSTGLKPSTPSTWPNEYSTDTQSPSSAAPTTVPSGTSTETVDASQLSSVQCASDSECGVAGHCYLGNELCGCLTTNCSGVAYEAMPNCGWYCQCEDATNQWRLQQCSPGTLFDEEKYTCNHGYTVEQTVCATDINCDAPLACPIPASTDVCWFDVRVYVKCLRSKYIKCAIDPTNEINDSNVHVELQNILYDVSQVEENYQNYMYQCLVYGNYYGSA